RGLGPNLTGGSNSAETPRSALSAIRRTPERHPATPGERPGVGAPTASAPGRPDDGVRDGVGAPASVYPGRAVVGLEWGAFARGGPPLMMLKILLWLGGYRRDPYVTRDPRGWSE